MAKFSSMFYELGTLPNASCKAVFLNLFELEAHLASKKFDGTPKTSNTYFINYIQ